MSASEQTFFVQVGEHRLRVRTLQPAGEHPAADAPTLIFLHDALGCIEVWKDFPAALVAATGLPALIYDRCGSGGSSPLPGLRTVGYLDEEVRCLEELLVLCGIERPILVGHSDGATIALLHAAVFPDRSLAVISEAAHVLVEEVTLQGICATAADYRDTGLREKLQRYHGEKTDALFAAWTETWRSPAFHDWNVEGRLAAIRCPVLALQGTNDEYGTPYQLEAICKGVAGRCRQLLLPDCAHVPHHQARERVLAEMAGFVQEIVAARAAQRGA